MSTSHLPQTSISTPNTIITIYAKKRKNLEHGLYASSPFRSIWEKASLRRIKLMRLPSTGQLTEAVCTEVGCQDSKKKKNQKRYIKLKKKQKKQTKFFSWNYEWEPIWKSFRNRQIGTVTFALHVQRSTKVKNRCRKQVRMVWIKTGTLAHTHMNKLNFLHRTEIRTHEINLMNLEDKAAVAASENWPKCVTTQWFKKKKKKR